MRRIIAFVTIILGTGCGPQTTNCPAPAQPTANAPRADVTAAPCAEAVAVGKDQKPNPEVMALAEAAKSHCRFDHGSFAYDCKEYKAWRSENDDLFEDAGGNEAILMMLEDSDVRMRALAEERGFKAVRAFFADKDHVKRLLAVIDKERESPFLDSYGKFVAAVDAEAMFTKEIQALATHPASELRESLARHELPQHASAFSIAMVKTFLDDSDDSVKRGAIYSLSANGRTRPTDAVCGLLKTQLTRTDGLVGEALEAGATSKCPGMVDATSDEIDKRSKDMAKFLGSDSPDLRSAMSSICWSSSASEPAKKRMFDIAVKAAQTIGADPWKKRGFIDLFRMCDVSRAKAALTPYAADKNKEISDQAKEELKWTAEALKNK